ncbi:MAG: transposase family protein [Psychrobacter alimentarius]
MQSVKLSIGEEVFNDNSRYRITAILDMEHVCVRSSFTGKTQKFHISELSSSPTNIDNSGIIPSVELMNIPEDEWIEIHDKAGIFNNILQSPYDDRRNEIKKAAEELDISEPTLYRQLQKYKLSNGDPTSLLRKKRVDKGRFEPEIEKIIQSCITQYLSTDKLKISDIFRSLEIQIYQYNKLHGSSLDTPHINTLRYRISQLTAAEIGSTRLGKNGRESYRPIIGKFPEVIKPLEIVQIDHTPLDVMIVDDVNRLAIGRPTITLAIDVFSRMVTGFYISLEKPNTLLTGCCITHSILDKKKWLADHKIDAQWPVYGLIDTIHTDNGKEFHGKALKRACEKYHISLTKRPVGTPRYGGHIERLFKTFNDGGIHTLPGTTKSNIVEKGEYDSEKKAVLTLFELETWFTQLVVNVYHHTVHSELGMTPFEKYKEGILGSETTLGRGLPPKIENELQLKIDFLPYEERSVQKYGIQLFGILYYHDLLRKWIRQPDKTRKNSKQFTIKYDPRDLSSVFFYDPDMNSYITIPYRNLSRPAISLWELREIKKRLADTAPTSQVTEADIFEARIKMANIVENASKETKKIRRLKQKETVRVRDSLPQMALKNEHLEEIHLEEVDDIDFDIQPFEDIEE